METNTTQSKAARITRATHQAAPQPSPQKPLESRQYRAAELAALLGVAQSTIWRWNSKGMLPKPRALSPGVTVWDSGELAAWFNTREA